MDVILVLMGIFLVAFTVAMIVLFARVGSEPSTLIGCVFAACTAEGGFMAMIKRSKTKKENSAPAEPIREDPASDDGAEKG